MPAAHLHAIRFVYVYYFFKGTLSHALSQQDIHAPRENVSARYLLIKQCTYEAFQNFPSYSNCASTKQQSYAKKFAKRIATVCYHQNRFPSAAGYLHSHMRLATQPRNHQSGQYRQYTG